jgi:hypothetical protein
MNCFARYSAEIQLNKREALRCERESVHGTEVIRFLRLKPNAGGDLRPAGPQLAFAAKHLPAFVAMLKQLQDQIAEASERDPLRGLAAGLEEGRAA